MQKNVKVARNKPYKIEYAYYNELVRGRVKPEFERELKLAFLYSNATMTVIMDDENYKRWAAYFPESVQQNFKDELKNWLRMRKSDLQRYCKEFGVNSAATSAYGMLAELMGISQSSINNWLSQKAQKQIPEDRVKEIEALQAKVEAFCQRAAAPEGSSMPAESREEFVKQLEARLCDEAIGKFYKEAKKADMTLDEYLLSLLR